MKPIKLIDIRKHAALPLAGAIAAVHKRDVPYQSVPEMFVPERLKQEFESVNEEPERR